MARRLWPLIVAFGVVGALGVSVLAAPPVPAAGVDWPVTIQEFSFQPSVRKISFGDRVVWTNGGNTNHTTTSDTGLWDSGTLSPTLTFIRTFTETGTFTYRCTIHPFMLGEIEVEPPPSTATPTRTRTPTRTATVPPPPTNTPFPTETEPPAPAFLPIVSRPFPSPTPTNTPTATATPPATETPLPAGVIPNGNFELGPVDWYEYGSPYDIIREKADLPKPLLPHSGSWAAWLGGLYDATNGIEQSVAVSSSRPYLSYWYWSASLDFCGYDDAYVLINNNDVVDHLQLCDDTDTNDWKRRTVNLSAYKGQTVVLNFEVSTDDNRNSNWFIDDISFVTKP